MKQKTKKPSEQLLVRRSVFAGMANVSPAAITKGAQNGLFPIHESGLIDINNVDCQFYISEHTDSDFKPVEVIDEVPEIDPEIESLFICIKSGREYRPVVAIEFSDDEDLAVMETIFPQDGENISIIKSEGIITGLQIGKKKHKPHYCLIDKAVKI